MKWLQHFLVYRCIGCDDPLPAERLLCPACAQEFYEECRRPCQFCGSQHIECGCFSNGKKSPFGRVLHIAPYRHSGITHIMITGCKTTRDLPLMRFLAFTAASEIERKVPLSENTVLLPLPRASAARRKHGFDQAIIVAKYAAEELGIPCLTLFHNRGSRPQKKLSYQQRVQNAKQAFSLPENAAELLGGKHVILYDDVTTTGATAIACAKLLNDCGVHQIDFCSFARTEE